MNTVELEAQKAWLAREILNVDSEKVLNNLWVALKGYNPVIEQPKKGEKRKLGPLDGKASVIFHDNWEMTAEELFAMR